MSGWVFAGNSDHVTMAPGPGDDEWTVTVRPAGKVTKASVRYRHATGRRRCATCVMFRAPDSCTLVAGAIHSADVCDRWAAR